VVENYQIMFNTKTSANSIFLFLFWALYNISLIIWIYLYIFFKNSFIHFHTFLKCFSVFFLALAPELFSYMKFREFKAGETINWGHHTFEFPCFPFIILQFIFISSCSFSLLLLILKSWCFKELLRHLNCTACVSKQDSDLFSRDFQS
jgi:hypothetical protein